MYLDVFINHEERTIHPAHPEGDVAFGLTSGTNGTGPEWRRRAVELANTAPEYTWRKYEGGRAEGLALVPPLVDTETNWANPWNPTEGI